MTVAKAFGIPDEHLSTFKVTCWEDNTAAETLANPDPDQSTPRSKFYDVKVHWFWSHLSKDIHVKRIDTKEQLADIFTKPLPEEPFQRLRKKILVSESDCCLSSYTFSFALFHVDFTVIPGLSSCVVVLTKTRTSGHSALSDLATQFYYI